MFVTTDDMAAVVSVQPVGPDRYVGQCMPNPRAVVFGGQLAAQALIAAGHTVAENRPVHALHATLFSQGDPAVPIEYQIDRVRDGRSYAARLIWARQAGQVLLQMTASFAVPEEGFEHQPSMPTVAGPDDAALIWDHPMQVRGLRWDPAVPEERLAEQVLWARSTSALPESQHLHAAAVVFVSDMTMGWSPWKAHGIHDVSPGMFAANLDHSVWFHRPFRADDWLLLCQRSETTASGRSLGFAKVFTADGSLAASVAQEGVMRRR